MSILLATFNKIVPSSPANDFDYLSRLDLPDFVKQDVVGRMKPYLKAIEIDGCSMTKIRKVIVLGNKGKVLFKI